MKSDAAARRDRGERQNEGAECDRAERERHQRDRPEQDELSATPDAPLHGGEGELGHQEEARAVERRALVDGRAADEEEAGVLGAEEDEAGDGETRAAADARDGDRDRRCGAAGGEQSPKPLSLGRGVARERCGRRSCRRSQGQTGASRAWRLNTLTSSIGAASGSPSRHSATGTPAA